MPEQVRPIPTINVERVDATLLPRGQSVYAIEEGSVITLAVAREHISDNAAHALSALLNNAFASGQWRPGPQPPQPGT
ncbi:hypothetical protein [Streptomyces sp. NPDC046909]|uniref:hypothetical protein n=1 Tax=Streptomyces sp. NPDC046909 TaxID=3155617 RepID=UPI0033F8D4D9